MVLRRSLTSVRSSMRRIALNKKLSNSNLCLTKDDSALDYDTGMQGSKVVFDVFATGFRQAGIMHIPPFLFKPLRR